MSAIEINVLTGEVTVKQIPENELPTAEEIAKLSMDNAARLAEESDIAAAKANAKLTALKGMTPAQVQTWVANNVTNLSQAQDAIATLAVAVSILARRM